MVVATGGDETRTAPSPSHPARSVEHMTEATPRVEGAEIDLARLWRSLPEPALGGLAATWQAILRVRHPEFTGLVVEVIDDSARGTAGSARRATPHLGLGVAATPPSEAAVFDGERTRASAS